MYLISEQFNLINLYNNSSLQKILKLKSIAVKSESFVKNKLIIKSESKFKQRHKITTELTIKSEQTNVNKLSISLK